MRKHPDLPLFLIVAASLAVLLAALFRLAGPGGPFDLSGGRPVARLDR